MPGLGVDVDALLDDKAARPAAPATSAPRQDARALVSGTPGLTETVERCHEALDTARETLHHALGSGRTHDTPAVEAWLALMDEVLNFGQAMTGALRGTQSQSMRRNQ